MGLLIGRKREQQDLEEYCLSNKAELICVYGRRRVGKTHLITETFQNELAFDVTGNESKKNRDQINAFHQALRRYGCKETRRPANWFDAFARLNDLLRDKDVRRTASGRRVVFFDEMPWLAAKRSDFMAAFSDFWNSVASRQDDMVVIICGSATSWIIKNIFRNTGSMYNRVTQQMYIEPFDLCRTEQMLHALGFDWGRETILLCHMIFGGLPYYLNMLDRRKSLAQNINALCLDTRAPLRQETSLLMEATLSASQMHLNVLRILAKTKVGLTRTNLLDELGVTDGGGVTRVLDDLTQCGYIRSYKNLHASHNPTVYQLIDPFLLFAFEFMTDRADVTDWVHFSGTPAYYAWRGNAFEMVCVNHVAQILRALGISGVHTRCIPWTSSSAQPGAQIDLLIERADGVTNVCEMKFTNEPYVMNAGDKEDMRRKVKVFREESHTQDSLLQTLVSVHGLRRNGHAEDIAYVVDVDDLFAS